MNTVSFTTISTSTIHMETEVKIKSLTLEELSDILCTAFYDNPCMSVDRGEGCKPSIDHRCFEDNLAQILLDGGHIEVTDCNAAKDEHYGKLEYIVSPDEFIFYKVTLKDILEGASNPECLKMIQDILSGDDSGKTLVCLPQERFSGDIEELFRTVFTGNGPEPVPGSAGHDDAIVVRVHIGVIVMCT